jgi:hypothetical protein
MKCASVLPSGIETSEVELDVAESEPKKNPPSFLDIGRDAGDQVVSRK